jgi:hypothetical protein
MNLTDFETYVATRIQDSAARLKTPDLDDAINQAVKQRYSQDAPNHIVTDVAADGSSLLPLPAGFEQGFSVIGSLEYPIGNVPPTYFDNEDWKMYRTPTAQKILLLSSVPNNTELVRVSWTQRHITGNAIAVGQQGAIATSVPDADFEAVCDLAAALCAEKLAASYAQSRDASITADSVNNLTKSQEYLKLATALRKRYDNHVGSDEETGKQGPAIAMGDMELKQGSGVDRLTHRRR